MAKDRIADLQFPLGGVDRSIAIQRQAPFTTPECLNVIPFDTLDRRGRGGRRPGFVRAFYDQIGNGNRINMLAAMTIYETASQAILRDSFTEYDTPASYTWARSNTPSGQYARPLIYKERFASVLYGSDEAFIVRSAPSDFDTTSDYRIGIYIAPFKGEFGGSFKLAIGLDGTDTHESDGAILTFTPGETDGTFSGNLTFNESGSETANQDFYYNSQADNNTHGSFGADDVYHGGGWLEMFVTATTFGGRWRGISLRQFTDTLNYDDFGFGMNTTRESWRCLASEFRAIYSLASNKRRARSKVFAISNGDLYKETTPNTLNVISSSESFSTDKPLGSASLNGLLFIADHGDLVFEGEGPVVYDANNDNYWIYTTEPWTQEIEDAIKAIGNDPIDNPGGDGTGYCQLYRCSIPGTHQIESADIHAPTGNLRIRMATPSNTDTIGWALCRVTIPAKFYNPDDNDIFPYVVASAKTIESQTEPTGGEVPIGCSLITRWQGRIVMGGPGPEWFMSAVNEPFNWDYSSEDVTGAIAGWSADAGEIGNSLTALIPSGDDYLLFGCKQEIWRLNGNPREGGRIINASREVGICAMNAWCHGPDGKLFFLSHDGIHFLPTGATGRPVRVSGGRIPDALLGVNGDEFFVSMEFDSVSNRIYITRTSRAIGVATQWIFDWSTRSYWPFTLTRDKSPCVSVKLEDRINPDSDILWGSSDGFIREFNRNEPNDEEDTVTGSVFIGPLAPGGALGDGIVDQLNAILPNDSGPITWSLHAGDSAEDALAATSAASGTWSAGANYQDLPRIAGNYIYLKLSGSSIWAIESCHGVLKPKGRRKLL